MTIIRWPRHMKKMAEERENEEKEKIKRDTPARRISRKIQTKT